jgi:ATP-dependent Clp protease protease subunit
MAKVDDSTADKSPGDMLRDHGMYVLMGEINPETVQPVVEWILYENYVAKHRKSELLLMICSEGGDLQNAFALIDVMNSSQIPIKTVGLGMIASSGLLVFMSGTPGRRVLTPNTSILSHQFSWHNEGKAHELFATMREYELTQQRMIEHYKRCTGQDDQTIRDFLLPAQDRWLSGEEALKLRICDAISVVEQNNNPAPKPKTKGRT